jgi:hypothetical protein
MLGRTTTLLNKTTAGIGKDGDVSAWKRGGPLHQLSIHYEWSSIVYDDRQEGGRAPEPVQAYAGGGMHGLRAGDRAPDAPALLVLEHAGPATNATRLFDLLHPAKHTILLFVKQGVSQDNLEPFLAAARQQPSDLTTIVLIFEKGSDHAPVNNLRDDELVALDSEGHAFNSYIADIIHAAVIRPDAMVGAMVGTVDGLKQYFNLIFNA